VQYRLDVHPIERLRFVARASGVSGQLLATETAEALASFLGDPAGLQIACQRILSRQPTSGALVWLAAQVLAAPDGRKALSQSVDQLEDDGTDAALRYALPDDACLVVAGWPDAFSGALRGRHDLRIFIVGDDSYIDRRVDQLIDADYNADVVGWSGVGQVVAQATHVLIGATAVGPTNLITEHGALSAMASAAHWNVPVWCTAPVGSSLPERMYEGLTRRWHESTSDDRWDRDHEEVPVELVTAFVTPAGLHEVGARALPTSCPIVPELF